MRKLMIINIFKKGHKQLNSGIDTWIVEWTRRYGQFSGDTEQCYQAFLSKEEADEFADSIRRGHKLIGNFSTFHWLYCNILHLIQNLCNCDYLTLPSLQ